MSVQALVTGTHPEAVAAVQAVLEGFKTGEPAARPSRWAGVRRRPDELVTVSLTGQPRPVLALARVLADVLVVTGMSHPVTDGPGSTGVPVIRIDVTCYPAQRLPREPRSTPGDDASHQLAAVGGWRA